MLPPDYLDSLPNTVVELFRKVEDDILEDMARRIVKTGEFTKTAQWQAWRLEQLGETREYIFYHLQRLTGKTQGEINAIFEEAGGKALSYDDQIYRAFGLTPGRVNDNPELLDLLKAGARQTQKTFQNLTATTANTATRQFERALDRAWLQVSSGAFDYKTAIRQAMKDLAKAGLQAISYPSGHTDALDVAVRRAVLTGINQTAARLSEARAEEMGCDLVETTAHPGARPEHAPWQGQVFSRSGKSRKYPDFVSSTGYGTGAGLCGWNCRHSFFPFFEGLSSSAYPREKLRAYENQKVNYNGQELTYYEATQQQRYIERKIRRWKREYLMMDAAGQDTAQAAGKLAQWRAAEREFCKQTGLIKDTFRSQAEGFGRRQASRAYWKNKKEIEKYSKIRYNKDGTIVVTDDWTSKKHPHFDRIYKPNAVVDSTSRHGQQKDRTVYDENGLMRIQIHGGNHGQPKNHPYGIHGEHIHEFLWDVEGKLVNKTTRNLTDEERKQHRNILREVNLHDGESV